ncbi:hypothetical protein L9F63_001930 [Diploptera punctata]|uniref:Uncharacterized protein n=1 Tax=Diploptera punctata TaxID=6984 RepID=A0AAD8A377_DIPPU|nr:hypothetical protein L9F63_001930 [Diploptera punctata]
MRGTASKQGNHDVFLHMSNHYRRLYNAKCTVDTSAPISYRRQQTSHIDLMDEGLINLIASDTKQSPNCYVGRICVEKGKQQLKNRMTGNRPVTKNFCKKGTIKVPTIDIIYSENFTSANKEFQPRILKTEAQSRLRDMRKLEEEIVSVELPDLCTAQKLLSSKESSRDSAYNGGISSGADTPEQASPVSDRYQLNASPSKSDSSPSHAQSEPHETNPAQQTSSIRNDAAYVHFVHNITEDILARGIYSDRGLRQLFERHLSNNKSKLNMDRMKQEIANLCRQLGIAEREDSKGEISTCMRSIEELMDVMRSAHRSDQHVPQDVTVPDTDTRNIHLTSVSQNRDKLENSAELLGTSVERMQTSNFNSIIDRKVVNVSCQTAPSSELIEPQLEKNDSCEKFVNISCQTSMVSEGVGSYKLTIPEDDVENVTSEFVDKNIPASAFSYTKLGIAEATEEMINRLDKYNILETLGMRNDVVKAAVELLTNTMEKAIISYRNLHSSGT